jgi:hypothetical protein
MSVKSKSGLTSQEGINIKLPLIIFEEDGTVICYCPTLDLSGYGYNEIEAIESYKYVMDEYLRHTIENNTLEKDLKRLGWQVKKNLHGMLPPPITKLLESNNNFKRVFEKFDYKKLNTNVRFPALS